MFRQLANVAKTNDGDNRKKVLKNDFVINSRSDRKGSSGLSKYDGSVSLINTVLKVRKDSPDYMRYLLKSVPFQEEFYRNGKGIVADLWSTNFQSMKSIVLPIPPIYEQKQIANYLDWKINEIDKLIAIEREKIKELEIYKQKYIDLLISSTNSESIPLKAIFDFGKGLSITKENLGKNGTKCISYGEIHNSFGFSFSYTNEELKGLEKVEGVTISKFAELQKGDFIFVDTSEDLKGCGNFTYLEDGTIKVYAGYHTIVAKCKTKFNYRYLAYCLESSNWRYQIRKSVKGIKVYSITQSILKNSKIQMPDDNLQIEIVSKTDNFIENQKRLISIINETIENLSSLKQSLISEVVTGQVDVRNVVMPYYEKVTHTNEEDIEELEEMEGEEDGN
ncbi:restriction endonuclease subunit S [Clostridioides difficile]|uniref:restriction endonuclease subunit S n=1 Tax=Clostridioides difficile TaxID=1496 RepID=UPI001F46AE58|nr:restriction endonuclease subunit S [Clostridioides difficile]MCI4264542.1 restriction endonuclease subunit S [Clostridioides difficile]MCK1951713.1 restriction endonuclease subunit S [Clostridioides difficile]MCK1954619.1 restriction endonuclease subunit S [Clostridioides difficile]MCM3858897.1 restriction endonuclease subunit S [Clostridioides difficile]MCV2268281.1 restriction endonuclease subunit S [Clostridioides difficile]